MPIIPSTTVGWRSGDAVVGGVVGWSVASAIAAGIGFLDGDALLRAAVTGKIDLSPAILAEVTTLSTVDGTVDVTIQHTLLAQFTLEVAASADTTVEVATKSSVTLKNLLDAVLKLES